jgi:hypothetical protein
MKRIGLILCLAVAGCGVGSDPAPQDKPMVVSLEPGTVLPSPFVVGPSGTQPVPFVVGPSGTMPVPFTVGPQPQVPVVTFVTGPVVGPVAVVNPPIIVVNPTTPPINWCTDGFVVGPCVPLPKRCQPGEFTVGPCP